VDDGEEDANAIIATATVHLQSLSFLDAGTQLTHKGSGLSRKRDASVETRGDL